ncbi:MAG: hypothetical protein PHE06_08445 [Lachnospiraceae bacterium]|nr:hypothetical protein [Lachnospiraceae bacterium]MDD3795980.1 hypothetical protein [Lachnospiraceae bacterium]
MDTNSVFGLMDVIVFGCGLYIIYVYYLLMAKNEIKKGVLVPQNTEPKKCKDLEGYKKFMGPRTLIFGIVATLSGGLGLYQDFVGPIDSRLYLAFVVLFIVVIIWFIMAVKKAEKLFW